MQCERHLDLLEARLPRESSKKWKRCTALGDRSRFLRQRFPNAFRHRPVGRSISGQLGVHQTMTGRPRHLDAGRVSRAWSRVRSLESGYGEGNAGRGSANRRLDQLVRAGRRQENGVAFRIKIGCCHARGAQSQLSMHATANHRTFRHTAHMDRARKARCQALDPMQIQIWTVGTQQNHVAVRAVGTHFHLSQSGC